LGCGGDFNYLRDDMSEIKLILGDCLEIMKSIPDKSIDLVLTDPPFNVGKDFANDKLNSQEWYKFCDDFASSCFRLNPANILIEVSKKDKFMRNAFDHYFRYRFAICLNYTNSMRQGTIGFHNWGMVLWYGDGKCHKRYKDRIDSAVHSTKKEFTHPSPKEITHYKKLVEMFSPKDGTVLDPFMGSGTTGVACKELGRNFIGIEIEPKYFEIAQRRINQTMESLL
jgi:DNA modification methylase